MRSKFNRASLIATLFSVLVACVPFTSHAESVPLIMPEATFRALPRITGDTLNQRLMDQHSIVRIQLPDATERLEPNTPLVVFRQGLRLTTSAGRVVGVLAVPIAHGRTLSKHTEAAQIADPEQPGVAWMQLQSLQQEVMRGDSIMTRAHAQKLSPAACDAIPPTDTKPPATEVIAIVSQADLMSSAGDLLAVSGGCAAGLNPGNTVSLWRPAVTTHGRKLDRPIDDLRNNSDSAFDDNPAITSTQTPSHRVGSARVVASYADTAILRVLKISQPAQPGDLVRPDPAKAKP